MIDKRKGQVLSIHENKAQVMDLENYETFEIDVPEELRGSLQAGQEQMYIETLGRRKLQTN
jgi:translation initiation factor 5A